MDDLTTARTIQDMQRRIGQIEVKEVASGSGTAFPSSPLSGMTFFRTDLGLDCYYDGTRWLTVEQFAADLAPFALNPLPYSTAAINTLLLAPSRSDRDYYVVRARAYVFVNTTNNTTNYWGFELRDDNVTSLWGFDTHLGAAGENLAENASINTVATISNYLTLTVTTKTGAPGTIGAIHCAVWYRLVIP